MKRVAESESRAAALEQKFSRLKETHSAQSEKYEKLLNDRVAANQSIIDTRTITDELIRTRQERDDATRAAQAAKERLASKMAALHGQRDDLVAKLRKVHEESKANYRHAVGLQQQVDVLQCELEKKSEENRVLTEHAQKLKESTKEMGDQAKKFGDLRAAHRDLTSQIRELRSNNAELLKQLEQLNSALDSSERLKNEFNRRSAELKSLSDSQARELVDLKQENERMSAQVIQSGSELAKLKTDRGSLVAEVKKLQREVVQATKTKEKLEADFQQLRTNANQLQAASENDRLLLTAKSGIIEALASELEKVKKSNTELKSLVVKLQHQVDNAHSNTFRLISDFDVTETDQLIIKLREQIDELEKSNSELSIRHEKDVDELNQSYEELEDLRSSQAQQNETDFDEVVIVKNRLIEVLKKLAELDGESASDGELVSDPGDDDEKPQTDRAQLSDEEDLEDSGIERNLVLDGSDE
jgi:chromosome segregation ATPase